jgi:glutaredoxin-related protein
MLQKIIIDKIHPNYNHVSTEIKDFLKKNSNFNGLIIVDCFGKVHTDYKNYIPQNFNNNIVFISAKSFQQNHIILSKQIRKYVANKIINCNLQNRLQSRLLCSNLLCIGGESYLYGLTNPFLRNNGKILNLTNNIYIYNDIIYNKFIYSKNKNIISFLIDYNNLNINENYNNLNVNLQSSNLHNDYNLNDYSTCIINISTLNYNLITNINKLSKLNIIIIISCHHDDFWKKIKLLTNYNLLSRKKFICYKLKYFLTVNIFIRKQTFVSLGYNCSVAWNLKLLNLRKESYPFDWCDISLSKLINVLSNNFIDYEKVEIIKLSNNFKYFGENEKDIPTFILNNKYNVKFAHEVISKIELLDFSNKLLERIERFKKLKNPTFIRIEKNNINTSYDELKQILNKYFDNYKLIIIPTNNFIDWKYSNLDWFKIINS